MGKQCNGNVSIEIEADPTAAAAKWATPLAWSRLKRHEEIENKLLSHGAAG